MNPTQILYQKLLDDTVIGASGKITLTLRGINVDIKDVSVVGNILQEWTEHFMNKHAIVFRKKENTQEFPDFILNESNNKIDLLEVKSFTGSANFDIANFSAYARSLRDHAYRLDAKYLIFEYTPIENTFVIDGIWMKNVWEICGASQRSPVKIQWKQSVPVNIRPISWYAKNPQFVPFESRKEFVTALSQVIGMAGIDSSIQKNWLNVVEQNYKKTTGNDL